jgi:hypothetical protein
MKTKYALAFWYNLKGNYDIIVFDNKRNLTKYVIAYKDIYNLMENGEIDFEEFNTLAYILNNKFGESVLKCETDIYYKDIKDNDFYCYIDNEKTKINIVTKLEYGF